MSQELTAAEAAARLGIKRATLYAYVSRGLVTRHMAMDGRTSLFDSEEIDTFRSDRRRTSDGELDTVVSTALTRVADGELFVRGQDLVAIAETGTSFEDAVAWVWAAEKQPWLVPTDVHDAVRSAQDALPHAVSLLDRLRVTVSVVRAMDPLRFDLSPSGMRSAGRSLISCLVLGLPLLGREAAGPRLGDKLWPRVTARRPVVTRRDAVNTAMVLLVDHGIAPSTFGARLAASVRADPYSVVGAGLGVVGGTLHGAASGAVHRMFERAHVDGAAEAISELQRSGHVIPGFGHAVYRTEDPRYTTLMAVVSDAWRDDPRLAVVHEVRDLVSRRSEALPNVDLALGALTWLAEMGDDAGEALFAIARSAGWLAHAIEESAETPLRFRPRARYIGSRTT